MRRSSGSMSRLDKTGAAPDDILRQRSSYTPVLSAKYAVLYNPLISCICFSYIAFGRK